MKKKKNITSEKKEGIQLLKTEVEELDIIKNETILTEEVDKSVVEMSTIKEEVVFKEIQELKIEDGITKCTTRTVPVEENIIPIKEEVTPLIMNTDKIMDTVKAFGKCMVTEDEIVVYNRMNFFRESIQFKLKKGDTFYFDAMHTTDQNNVYVSWNGMNGKRNYTLFKDNTGKMPVIKISLE